MQRLNGQDALMVYGEATGWPLHLGSLQVYDAVGSPEGLDLERVRDLYRQRLPHLPVFRNRLVQVPGGLDRPVWVEDPHVDVDAHIHGVRLPAPGTDRQLAELAGALFSPLIDRTRPLWEIWVIEGLERGRIAVLARVHHAAVDGVRGLQIQAATYDIEPDAPIVRPGGAPGAGAEMPGTLTLLGGAAVRLAGAPARALRTGAHLALAGGHLAGVVGRGRTRGLTLPLTAPRTSLNRAVSTRRGLAFCSLPLAPVKAVAKAEGVTVNDVVLAVTSGALRRYLDERGELPDRPLVAGVPVGFGDEHPSEAASGNRWAVMLASLATDVEDPVERLHRIATSARTGKVVQHAIGQELWRDLVDLPARSHRPRRARLLRTASGRRPPAAGQRRRVRPARRALPALPRRRPAAGELPDRADRRRARSEHHGDQLPGLARFRAVGLPGPRRGALAAGGRAPRRVRRRSPAAAPGAGRPATQRAA